MESFVSVLQTFQADIQQTQDGGSFGDDGAISEFDSTGSLAVVMIIIIRELSPAFRFWQNSQHASGSVPYW